MVLPFQAQEVAREDVQEAQLPAVLIDVEVRHHPHDTTSCVKDALLADFVAWWSGMLMQLQPDQGHGYSFLTGACEPCHLYYHRLNSTVLKGPHSPKCLERGSVLKNSSSFSLGTRFRGRIRRFRSVLALFPGSLGPLTGPTTTF